MRKREKLARTKRKRILASRAFKRWWKWRRNITPVPDDPYHAFMTDLGKYAKLHHLEVWRMRTNRKDYPPIDYPVKAPARKRRLPPRKHIRRYKRVPKPAMPPKVYPWVEKEVEQFIEKYHLPSVEVRVEKRRGAAYTPSLFGKAIVKLPTEYVESVKEIPRRKQQVLASTRHELGHHAHFAFGGRGKATPKTLASIITEAPRRGSMAQIIKGEKIAWRVAEKYKKPTSIMKWRKKWALGTYLGTTPPVFNLGEVRKKSKTSKRILS